jgi:hypothetical protein
MPDHIRGLRKDGPFAGQNRETAIRKWEEDQKVLERFAAALPQIAKRAQIAGELHLPGIGKSESAGEGPERSRAEAGV